MVFLKKAIEALDLDDEQTVPNIEAPEYRVLNSLVHPDPRTLLPDHADGGESCSQAVESAYEEFVSSKQLDLWQRDLYRRTRT